MNDKKYDLTISVMTSGVRNETLVKTLESIRPILENVSSELIITDTGCDEETLKLVSNYTDNIIKFRWCNDFSAARNASIEASKGHWFMFLDDDEWFENVDDIINFFSTGESERYNAFDYIQRNYENYEGTVWTDTIVGRAVRMVPGQKFVDIIHEKFLYNIQPVKQMRAFVHHYGYIYKTKEDEIKHQERNLSLLKKQMAAGNHSLRQYVHMLQEYNGLRRHDEAYVMAVQGIDMSIKNGEHILKYVSGIKTNIIYSLIHMEKYEKAVDKALEYIKDGGINISAYCAINCYLAQAWFNLRDSQGTIDAVKEYLGLLAYLGANQAQKTQESVLAIEYALTDNMRQKVYIMALKAAEGKWQ